MRHERFLTDHRYADRVMARYRRRKYHEQDWQKLRDAFGEAFAPLMTFVDRVATRIDRLIAR